MYLIKEKFNFRDLANVVLLQKRVLLVIDEITLQDIYVRHLEAQQFLVTTAKFADFFAIAEAVKSADMLILDFNKFIFNQRLEFLKSLVKSFPHLPVITIGFSLEEEMLSSLMALGIVGHLDRKLSRPQDLLALIKTLIV